MQEKTYPRYDREQIEGFITKAKAKHGFYYPQTDAFLYNALARYSITNKTVLIIGENQM